MELEPRECTSRKTSFEKLITQAQTWEDPTCCSQKPDDANLERPKPLETAPDACPRLPKLLKETMKTPYLFSSYCTFSLLLVALLERLVQWLEKRLSTTAADNSAPKLY